MSTKSSKKARNKVTKRLRGRESERNPTLIMRMQQKKEYFFVSYLQNIMPPKLFVFYSALRWTSLVSIVLSTELKSLKVQKGVFFFRYLTKIELGILPLTQWAAVTTHRLVTKEPPQNGKPEGVRNIACQGQPPGWAWLPPTILVWPVWGRPPQEP